MRKETIHQFTLTVDRNTSLENNVSPSKYKRHCALLVQLVDNVDNDEKRARYGLEISTEMIGNTT